MMMWLIIISWKHVSFKVLRDMIFFFIRAQAPLDTLLDHRWVLTLVLKVTFLSSLKNGQKKLQLLKKNLPCSFCQDSKNVTKKMEALRPQSVCVRKWPRTSNQITEELDHQKRDCCFSSLNGWYSLYTIVQLLRPLEISSSSTLMPPEKDSN